MKPIKYYTFFTLLIAFAFNQTGFSQTKSDSSQKSEKFYFKDTEIKLQDIKIEISQAVASDDNFKMLIIVHNTSSKYIIIDPIEIYATVGKGDVKWRDRKTEKITIEPKQTEKIPFKFKGFDFRGTNPDIHINDLKITDSEVAVYDFKDLLLAEENVSLNGPVRFTITNKDFDIHKGIRITAKLKYRGDKFLAMNLENALLKTNDGGTFYNVLETGGLISIYNNKYYRSSHVFEKLVLCFPAKIGHMKKESGSKLNLTNVFKEYSLKKLDDVTVSLNKSEVSN